MLRLWISLIRNSVSCWDLLQHQDILVVFFESYCICFHILQDKLLLIIWLHLIWLISFSNKLHDFQTQKTRVGSFPLYLSVFILFSSQADSRRKHWNWGKKQRIVGETGARTMLKISILWRCQIKKKVCWKSVSPQLPICNGISIPTYIQTLFPTIWLFNKIK